MGGGKVGERDKRSRRSGGRGLRVRVVVYIFFSRGGCEDVSLNIARADPVPHLRQPRWSDASKTKHKP